MQTEILNQIEELLEEDLRGWETEVTLIKKENGNLIYRGYRNLFKDMIIIKVPDKDYKTVDEIFKYSTYQIMGDPSQNEYSLY